MMKLPLFLVHVKAGEEEAEMKGKLIVFEGTDGSGKTTQVQLLSQRLTREGVAFRDHRLSPLWQSLRRAGQTVSGGRLGQEGRET